MNTTIAPLHAAVRADVLALADSKLVLGNWYAECVINGRSLPDFAAMLGMGAANYGHARALYQFLASFGESYAWLERGRSAAEIHSMELLDRAPDSWEDFIASIWLAELSTWTLASAYLSHCNRTLAGIARKIGQEAYFHLKYVQGWVRVFADSDDCRGAFLGHLQKRLPLADAWFGRGDTSPACDAGEAALPPSRLRALLAEEVAKTLQPLGAQAVAQMAGVRAGAFGADWRDDARRHGPLPARLFEVIRFKHPELAH